MGVEMKIGISADDTASPVLDKVDGKVKGLGAGGPGKIELLAASMTALGQKSDDVFSRMEREAREAFDQIKGSGIASVDEIERAERGLNDRLATIHKESAGTFGQAMDEQAGKAQGFFGRMKDGIATIKTHWLGFTAAAAAAMGTVAVAWDWAQKSAAYAEQRDSLNRLAAQYGTTADSIVRKIKEITGGMVSMSDAVDASATAMKNKLTPDQIYQMAAAAEKLSNITGSDVPESFKRMIDAVGRGQERALEAEVGVINLEERFGKIVQTWTESEKAGGRLQIVMERMKEASDALGDSAESVDDRFARFKAEWEDLKIGLGEVAVRIFSGLASVVYATAASLDAVGLAAIQAWRGVQFLVPGFENAKRAAFEMAEEFRTRMQDSLAKSAQNSQTLVNGLEQVPVAMDHATNAANKLKLAMREALPAPLSQGEIERRAEEERKKNEAAQREQQARQREADALWRANTVKVEAANKHLADSLRGWADERITALAGQAKAVAALSSTEAKAHASALARRAEEKAATEQRKTAEEALRASMASARGLISEWGEKYRDLAKQHADVLRAMEDRQRDHESLMRSIAGAEKAGQGALEQVRSQGDTEAEAWFREKLRLQQLYNEALAMEGKERASAIAEWEKQRAAFTAGISREDIRDVSRNSKDEALRDAALEQDPLTQEQARQDALADLARGNELLAQMRTEAEAANAVLAEQQRSYAAGIQTRTDAARQNIQFFEQQVVNLDASLGRLRVLAVDADKAIVDAQRVKAALDAIPDVTTKQIVMRVMTQASPIRPFSEGMDEVRRRLETLPATTSHTIKVSRLDLQGETIQQGTVRDVSKNPRATPAPPIQINAPNLGDGGRGGRNSARSMVKELDYELAILWRSKRSALRFAMAMGG